ncbi:MAG: 50S ribosomal protein L19 [Candidatus Taylorbacteria bacterium]|nr:50S ribosomal protein L19 [Candidatus Taylorbacteria bacterium]
MTANFTVVPINTKTRGKLDVRAGDTVRVWQRITERVAEKAHAKAKEIFKEKMRLQAFEGLVLARKHGSEPGATFTVRKVVDGVGVEKIFPLYAPTVEKVEILRRSKVRRVKLYHIRKKAAKAIRREMRNARAVRSEETGLQPTTDNILLEAKT